MPGSDFDLGGEFLHRGDVEIGWHAECDQRVGHARDRHEIFWIVRQLFVQQRVRGEGRGRREQQHMVVMRIEHCGNGEKGIATRAVLDDDRLAPFRRKLVGQQPGGDVDARTGTQRNDKTNRALRPD